jgi:hypothetical protein
MPSGFLSWIIGLVLRTFASATLDWLGSYVDRKEKEETIRRRAVAEAEAETLREIGETADEQSRVNAADRGTASDVARRLRDRITGRLVPRYPSGE